MGTIPFRNRLADSHFSPAQVLADLGIKCGQPNDTGTILPFSPNDLTCGTEHELQAVVEGDRREIDLPLTIEASNYYKNLITRRGRGELNKQAVNDLEAWLKQNPGVWENSWVRFSPKFLSPLAANAFAADLLIDKSQPDLGRRTDINRFVLDHQGEKLIRVPVSYLLKLALVDAVGAQPSSPYLLQEIGLSLANHFLSDNTSPETFSFHLILGHETHRLGRAVASETARRFLLSQLLVQYAG
ncbi:MAG: hypothetical protein HQK55_16390 [Deltaproteobacteria bacterium]|nr:hypothetical protein [Deltaproteobacteria bacterium]